MLGMTLKPFKYIMIKHDDKKWFDFIIPALLSIILSVVFYRLDKPFPLVGSGGLIPQVNALLQMLIGFYIASLAAIATFGNSSIDDVMAGTPPTLKIKVKGNSNIIPLTRRRFLCYLFGYLALMSIFLYLAGVVATLVGYSGSGFFKYLSMMGSLGMLKAVLLFFYMFFLINLVLTTMLGLYYLSVRIHESA